MPIQIIIEDQDDLSKCCEAFMHARIGHKIDQDSGVITLMSFYRLEDKGTSFPKAVEEGPVTWDDLRKIAMNHGLPLNIFSKCAVN